MLPVTARAPSGKQRPTAIIVAPPTTYSSMGSKPSKAKHPTAAKTNTATIPRIPQDIIDEILDHLATDSNLRSLRSCALVSKSWVQSCRPHLFRFVTFTSGNMERWITTFPALEESPAHHVRDLRVWVGGKRGVSDNLFEYTWWFSNAERMSLVGYGGFTQPRIPSLWSLPQSISSLIVDTDSITLVQVRDVMAQLPNLDNLSLSGSLAAVDRRDLSGIGSVLRGRFGGKLALRGGYADESVINMLLEAPSRLHFTEVLLYYRREHLLSTVKLAEAFCKTLVKLSHKVATFGKSHP